MRKSIIAALTVLSGVLTSSATVTVQGWWHYGEVPGDYYSDSSSFARRFGEAFSRVGSGNAGAGVQPFGVGGPLGNTGFISTNCLYWTPTHADAAGMWAAGNAAFDPKVNGDGVHYYNPPATNYVIECWYLPEWPGTRGGNGAWLFCSGSSGGVRFRLTNDTDNVTMTLLAEIVGNNTVIGTPLPADTNRWTHLAIVNNNGTNTFYVDGVQHGPSVDPSLNTVPNSDMFAGSAPGTQPTFAGYLDELRISTFDPGQFSTNDLLLRPSGPSIISQPQDAEVWNGGAGVFTIGAAFDNSTTYQWQRGAANIAGATASEHYIPTVGAGDNGAVFDCVVNNSSGIAKTSSNATLTIVPVQTDNVNFYRAAVQSEQGLVGYFIVDNDTGPGVANITDGAHSGTIEGTTSFDGRTNRAFGVRSLRFKNTADGDVTIPNNPDYEFANGNGTVEAIVYLEKGLTPDNKTIFSLTGGPTMNYYQVQATADGTSLVYFNDSLTQPLTWSLPVPLVNRFAHVAVVFTNNTATAYVDGLSLGSKPHPSFGPVSGVPAYIGSSALFNTTPAVWVGNIDELAIYKTALSANAIAIHNSRFIYGTNVTAPTITGQPGTSKTLLAGGSPTFTVTAAGTAPLSYQWYHSSSPISGATAATLTLNATTTGSSGDYFVRVSNPIGSTDSQPFTLTFVAPTDRYATRIMADNPSAFWRLDETAGSTTAVDSAGGHDGTFSGALTFGATGAIPGVTDTSVTFGGGWAEVPYAAALNPSTPFSIEYWANPASQSIATPLCSQFRNGSGRSGWCFYDFNDASTWEVHFGDSSGVTMFAYGGGPTPTPGEWHHIVAVYDGTNTVTLYAETQVVGSATGNYAPNPSAPLEIGRRNGGALAWSGGIDEVAIYNYALTFQQISNHWSYKFAPSAITQQPVGVTNTEGSTITLTAVVSGFPNTYQWAKDGVTLTSKLNPDGTPHYQQDVTNASLVISQARPSDSGQYHVVVGNALGGSVSTDAKVLVLADTNLPAVTMVSALGTPNASGTTPYLVKVVFNKRVDVTTGESAPNYTLSGGATINGVMVPVNAAGDWRMAVLNTSGLTPGQKYTLTVSGVKDQAETPNTMVTTATSFTAPVLSQGSLVWDYYYLGSPVSGIDTLISNPYYPNAPQTNLFVTLFDSDQITGGDINNNPAFGALGDNYGCSLSGWLTPTQSGNYTFFIASDDASQLWLSPDASVSGATLIAEETGCCHGFQDPGAPTTSSPQALQAGKPYFIRALQTEGTGGDYVKVAWRIEGDPTLAKDLQPIPGQFLSSYAPVPPPMFNPPTLSNGQLTITWTGTGTLYESTDLVNWTPVPGNPVGTYTVPATGPQKFYVLKQ